MTPKHIIDKFYKYSYSELNFTNVNFLLRNGFRINKMLDDQIYMSNFLIEMLPRKGTDTLFSIDILIYFKKKEIHSYIYIDTNKNRN